MSDLKAKYDNMITEQRKIKAQFQENGTKLIKEVFKEFFDKNPGITAVVWTQYTPFFNDGDTCTFSVSSPTFTNAPDDELYNVAPWGVYEGENTSVWVCGSISNVLTTDREYYKDERVKINASGGVDVDSCSLLESMISSDEMEEIFLALFDDHVKVVATRNGFDVTEYDHD
jgi:hypothetical protein